MHSGYNATSFNHEHDIALLRVNALTFTSSTQPIQLSSSVSTGASATVYGWGITETGAASTVLRQVEVSVISLTLCGHLYGSGIMPGHICAGVPEGGKDSCQGDSGGPLIENTYGKLAGIVSWGYGCGEAAYPGVYTNVAAYKTWVENFKWDAWSP